MKRADPKDKNHGDGDHHIMAPTASNTSSFNLRSILKKGKLSGTNFIDWHRNLRIVLKQEKKEYVLEEPHPDEPADNAAAVDQRAYEKHANDSIDVSYLMLAYVILQSLPASFEPFILSFHMNGMVKSMAELHGMLKTAEESIKKSSSHVMMIQKDSKKRKRKGKAKASYEILNSKPKPLRKSKLTPPGLPQWNGLSKWRNQTLLDMVRSMMSQSDLPLSFWDML
ncbi:hypothetical protein ABZP36_035200 [Zizania latifolia]